LLSNFIHSLNAAGQTMSLAALFTGSHGKDSKNHGGYLMRRMSGPD
jgi:hypothetical protein